MFGLLENSLVDSVSQLKNFQSSYVSQNIEKSLLFTKPFRWWLNISFSLIKHLQDDADQDVIENVYRRPRAKNSH